jgi:transposase
MGTGPSSKGKGQGSGPNCRRSGNAAELFAKGRSAATVADELDVARQTATKWRARWQSGGTAALQNRKLGRQPVVPDSQLPAIEQALLKGAEAHGLTATCGPRRGWRWSLSGLPGAQLGPKAVHRLLRERLGWSFQPAPAHRRRRPEPSPPR